MSAALEELITNEVAATMEAVGADRVPCVPPGVLTVRNILEEAVTAVVAIVTEPAVMATEVPIEAFAPVAIESLLPAVDKTRLPLVAVMLPNVAVMLVPALTAPAVETMLPVVDVIPVPAVTVVPAETDPNVAAMFPALAVMLPKVATIFPALAVTPPVVAITPVPAVTVVPAAKLVVVVKEPGATMTAGSETVAVPTTVFTVISFAVPKTEVTGPFASAIVTQTPPPE